MASSSTPPTWRILIVDDQPESGEFCRGALSTVSGYEVSYEQDPLLAQTLVHEWQPDLVILDVKMDALDGFTLGKRLKADERCRADLMFVTSSKEATSEFDGLEFAEEYVTKPYDVKVLVRRVEKLLTRRQLANGSVRVERNRNSSRPEIDLASRFVRVPHGRDATLTPTELRLLLALLEHVGKPVPYSMLLSAVWQVDDERATGRALKRHKNRNLVNMNVLRVRKKIEMNPKQPELIVNVPRFGYCYVLRRDEP